MNEVAIAIVGGGPAGLTAAIYAARERLDAVVIDEFAGGQILQAGMVDNYPALPGIAGEELGEAFRQHAEQRGAQFLESAVTRIEKEGNKFILHLFDGVENSILRARSVIYAAGCQHRPLGVEGEERLAGHGVSYCASCDAAFYPDKAVAIVGGGNTALSDALILSRIAKTVYLVHRRDEFRASADVVEAVRSTENIQLVLNSVPLEVEGERSVEALRVRNTVTGEQSSLPVDGVFVAVGMNPDTAMISALAPCDAAGYVIADETGETGCPGLFVAGDVRTKQLRQVITAAADGANCVKSAEAWLRRQNS